MPLTRGNPDAIELNKGPLGISLNFSNVTNYFLNRPAIFEIAFWIGLSLIGLILLTFLYLLVARLRFIIQQRRRARVAEIWTPVFKPGGEARRRYSARIPRSHLPYLLNLWTDYRAFANDEYAVFMDKLAGNIGLDVYIHKILTRSIFSFINHPVWLRSLAITATRWIHTPKITAKLWRATESTNRLLAVSACTALVQLQADNYEKAIIKTLFRFPEEAATITTRIGAAGGGNILKLLQPFLDKLPNYAVTNFIALAERSKDPDLLPVLEEKLRHYRNDEEAGALLRAIGHLGSARQKPSLIPFLHSQNSNLRVQALKSLGRIGDQSDVPAIIPFLEDSNWWVRYRAAEAIVLLSDGDHEKLEHLVSQQTDRFAVDILRHVINEKDWCAT